MDPRDYGVVELGAFMRFCAFVFLVVTVLLVVFVNEVTFLAIVDFFFFPFCADFPLGSPLNRSQRRKTICESLRCISRCGI